MNDRELIELIKEKDAVAYEMLYNRYWNELYVYAVGRIKHPEAAEDLLQELWIRVWTNPDFILTNEQFSAKGFFLKFLNFRVLDYYRSLNAEIISLDDERNKEVVRLGYAHILEDIHIADLKNLIDKATDALPVAMGNIVRLRLKGHSVAETAAVLSVTPKTVRNKASVGISRIKAQLRAMLTKLLSFF